MRLFKNNKKINKTNQTSSSPHISAIRNDSSFSNYDFNNYLSYSQNKFYKSIRECIPIIDSAILKKIRLIGGFTVKCDDVKHNNALDFFVHNVKVGTSSYGIESFITCFLDNLLTFGNAVGEIVLSKDMSRIEGLHNADISRIHIKPSSSPIYADFFVKNDEFSYSKVKFPELICFSALNPPPSQVYGVSILNNLPFVSSILLKIYDSIGKNFERIGNVRFAINYKTPNDEFSNSFSKERLKHIANEWSSAMSYNQDGAVKDFITTGDVNIKVIGADNQIIDTEVPVKQMLEQIIAKLSIPPFLLGLSWSTSERMSKQQADILTSELNYYRRLLSPVIIKIARTFLRLNGSLCEPYIVWSNINLQDEVELAKARYYNARAMEIESNLISK